MTNAELQAALARDLETITRHYRSAIDAAAVVEETALDADLDLSLATVGAMNDAARLSERMNALARQSTDYRDSLALEAEAREAQAYELERYQTSSPFVASLVSLDPTQRQAV